jgi:hypothetical protein
MAIVPLPLPPGAEARALLHDLLEQGDIMGMDAVGRTIIQLAANDGLLEKLITFDAEAAELEDGGPGRTRGPQRGRVNDRAPARGTRVKAFARAWR